MENRKNWKKEVAENTAERTKRKNDLLARKEEISNQLRQMTIEERRSSAYDVLMDERAGVIAQLATL